MLREYTCTYPALTSKQIRKIAAILGGSSGNTVTSGLIALGLLLLSDAIDAEIQVRDRGTHRAPPAKLLQMSFIRLVEDGRARQLHVVIMEVSVKYTHAPKADSATQLQWKT